MKNKTFQNPFIIISQSPKDCKNKNHSHQLSLPLDPLSPCWQNSWGASSCEVSPYLQIASVAVAERINPKEPRYILLILPHGIRACGGQFTAEEAHTIAQKTKGWDWDLDENRRLRCLPRLEALLDSICQRSSQKGGEG